MLYRWVGDTKGSVRSSKLSALFIIPLKCGPKKLSGFCRRRGTRTDIESSSHGYSLEGTREQRAPSMSELRSWGV